MKRKKVKFKTYEVLYNLFGDPLKDIPKSPRKELVKKYKPEQLNLFNNNGSING